MKSKNLVYSTNPEWKAEEDNSPTPSSDKNYKNQTAYIERDRKKRGGKTVTVISNLKGDLNPLKKELQKLCGSGGSLKNGQIEIQGDFRDKIAEHLLKKGIKSKYRGG